MVLMFRKVDKKGKVIETKELRFQWDWCFGVLTQLGICGKLAMYVSPDISFAATSTGHSISMLTR